MTDQKKQGAQPVPEGFAQTLATLKAPIDPAHVKTREGWRDRQGNTHMVEYVEWHHVADLLDRLAPRWNHAVRNVVQIGDIVAVTASITIDGITREGVGTGTAENESGIKKAEHDALKRAAIKFGVGRELYKREGDVIERNGSANYQGQDVSEIRDPLAKSISDLVTPKQLGMIRALAREAGVDAEEECHTTLRCKTDELSKRAASSLIDHLKGLQGGPDTETKGEGSQKSGKASQQPAGAAPAPSDEPAEAGKPATEQQNTAIAKLIGQWQKLEQVKAGDITRLAQQAGASDWRKMTEPQAEQFISLLNGAIKQAKQPTK